MATRIDPRLQRLQDTIAANLEAILARRGLKGADLAKMTAARGGATKRTIYHALNGTQPAKLQTLLEYAEVLEIPVWALLLEPLKDHPELLAPGALKPLVKLIENYVETHPDKRAKVERMAQAMRDETDLD